MRTLILMVTSILLFSPKTARAQDSRAALEAVAKALGATGLKSIEIQGGGTVFQVGQAYTAGTAWPQFNVRSFTRVVSYDTASLRDDILRTRAREPPKGGGPYVRGEHRQVFVLSGDHAWNVMGETAAPAPITLADRQFQLCPPRTAGSRPRWRAEARSRVASSPSRSRERFKAAATLDAANLIERVEATVPSPVLGDLAVTVRYADHRDFSGVTFPTKIRQTYGGSPALELTVTEASSVRYEMHMYPGTQHGFDNNSTPRYHEAALQTHLT